MSFTHQKKCRVCGSSRFEALLEFASMPLTAEPVPFGSEVALGPLTVRVCLECGYVFLREVTDTSMYRDYIYTPQNCQEVKSYLRNFVAETTGKLMLAPGSAGLEIGSGDGSLCREFNEAGVDFIGVEPSTVLTKISREQNQVETWNEFLSKELVDRLRVKFDLVVVRHVLEHIDNFTAFFQSIDICLKENGTLVIEVPYLGDIVNQKQFYAFFFEHLSYFSVSSLANLLKSHGFFINHVQFVHPEGGSVLVHASREPADDPAERSDYLTCSIESIREAFSLFRTKFEAAISEFGPMAAYGAGQRGITLLNLLGASHANVVAVFDENPIYHGLFTPKSGIPVKSPLEMDRESIPGQVLILASSYEAQIRGKYRHMKDRFLSLSELA